MLHQGPTMPSVSPEHRQDSKFSLQSVPNDMTSNSPLTDRFIFFYFMLVIRFNTRFYKFMRNNHAYFGNVFIYEKCHFAFGIILAFADKMIHLVMQSVILLLL